MLWPRIILVLILALLSPCAAAFTLVVKVEGVKGDQLRNVLAFLDIEQEKSQAHLLPTRVRQLHGRAPGQIKRALEPFGLYRVQVTAELIEGADVWEARYQIEPGPVVTIGSLDLRILGEGKDDPRLIALREDFPIQVGQPLEHARYEQAKTALRRRARTRGYLDAQLTAHEVRVDLESYTASVVLHQETGVRYAFGEVSFEQDEDIIDEDLLRRYVTFERGQPYSYRALLDLHGVLVDSGYFAQVEVIPQRDLARDNEVPIQVTLRARKGGRYRVGVGFGTDTGARASFGYLRRVNRKGHNFALNTKVAQREQSLNLGYTIPLANPATEELALTARVAYEDTESRQSDLVELGVSRRAPRGKWLEVLAINYEWEDWETGLEQATTQLLYPSVSWSLVEADDPLYPNHGYSLSLRARGALEALLSDTSFLQGGVAAKWVRRLNENYRFITRGQAGATLVASVLDLPASKRFYAGGDQSVRGYRYEALGPTDPAGLVEGGKYLLVGSVELERRITGKWSAAAFWDAGNAFNNISNLNVAHGAGVGIRWRSPVGPIRLDVAWGLSDEDNPWRLHIVMGPDL